MISASLLTALKVAVPVGTVASMGGAIYFASEYLPRKSTSSDVVYLLVKGKTQQTATSKALTTSENSAITKNYLCQSTIGEKKIEDKNCTLFKLNATDSTSIDINEKVFTNDLLETAANTITTTSHHILKVSKSFYSSFMKVEATKQDISLLDKANKEQHLGVVSSITKLTLNSSASLAEQKTNLFLARITVKGTATGTITQPLSCKLSETKTVPCKVYKAADQQTKTNSHTNTTLSNLTALASVPSNDTDVGTYLVVELTDAMVKVSELQNKTLTIHTTLANNVALADTHKIAQTTFDQLLIGKVNTGTPTSSTVFPVTAKKVSYVVQKATNDSNALTGIKTTSDKNYKCKFGADSKINFDNSCELKAFPSPTSTKLHSYSSIQAPSTPLTGVETGPVDKDHYVLTFDSNKLFNLKPDWSKADQTDVVVLVEISASPEKTATFNLLHELTPTKATGRTNLALVKYKTKVEITTADSTPSPASGQCFFEDAVANSFACSFKATKTPASPTTPFADLTFETSDATTFAADSHHALLVTAATRNIKDFEAKTINFHLTENSKHYKHTFDIIGAIGGDVADTKIAYFLEEPRTPANQTK